MKQRVLITGAAGFIGSNLIAGLLREGSYDVVGVDNFSAPYGVSHCQRRAEVLQKKFGFNINFADLSNTSGKNLFNAFGKFEIVIHLAAWPGVRFSQLSPHAYYVNNVNAFGNILDYTNFSKPSKFFFASSSSVYGDLAESGPVAEESTLGENLKSFYAATKWTNEVLAESYQHISKVPTVALRFFTFYGPEGRPDMAYWQFLESILGDREIELFGNHGGIRNFTFIQDAVEILLKLIKLDFSEFKSINIASSKPITTLQLLEAIGHRLKTLPRYRITERPKYDANVTHADTSLLRTLIGDYRESDVFVGINSFVDWYQNEYLNYKSSDSKR